MRLHEIYESTDQSYYLWKAPVRISQPGYFGRIVVTVSAPNSAAARALIKSQYNVKNYHIGPVTRLPRQKGLV